MRYKLGLSFTDHYNFLVSAKPLLGSNPPATAHFNSDHDFLNTLAEAQIAPDEHARLVYAAMVAVTMPEMGVCCEEVTLDPYQLRLLRLEHSHQEVA